MPIQPRSLSSQAAAAPTAQKKHWITAAEISRIVTQVSRIATNACENLIIVPIGIQQFVNAPASLYLSQTNPKNYAAYAHLRKIDDKVIEYIIYALVYNFVRSIGELLIEENKILKHRQTLKANPPKKSKNKGRAQPAKSAPQQRQDSKAFSFVKKNLVPKIGILLTFIKTAGYLRVYANFYNQLQAHSHITALKVENAFFVVGLFISTLSALHYQVKPQLLQWLQQRNAQAYQQPSLEGPTN